MPLRSLDVPADDDAADDRVGAGEVTVAPVRLEGVQVHAHRIAVDGVDRVRGGGGEARREVLVGVVEVLAAQFPPLTLIIGNRSECLTSRRSIVIESRTAWGPVLIGWPPGWWRCGR